MIFLFLFLAQISIPIAVDVASLPDTPPAVASTIGHEHTK